MKQLLRYLNEIGLARILILIIIGIITLIRIIPTIETSGIWLGLTVVPIILSVNSTNKESEFLQILDHSPLSIKILKSFIFTLPILLWLLIIQNFSAILIGIFACFAIPILQKLSPASLKISSKTYLNLKLIPWTVGLRKSFIIIIMAYILALFGLENSTFLFLGLLLIHFISTSFLYHNESHSVLQAKTQSTRKFLKSYSLDHLKYYLILQLPLIVISFFLESSISVATLLILLLLILHQLLSIYLKFTFYEPGISNDGMQSIQVLMFFLILIPFTIPVVIWSLFRYRNRALLNLAYYI